MVLIAVVDDLEKDRTNLIECVSAFFKENNIEYSIKSFSSGEEFLLEKSYDFDIVFLDVEMENLNGIETAKRIRKVNQSCLIIFATSFAKYALNGYEVEAFDFLVKPVDKYIIKMKLQRALSRINTNEENSILIKTENERIKLDMNRIVYVEVFDHYIKYHMIDNKEYSEYSSLTSAEKRLDSRIFAKCNRCYLVNMRYIESVKRTECVVKGEVLQISRTQIKPFFEKYYSFLGGKK